MTLHNSVIPQLMLLSPSCNILFHQSFDSPSCKQINYAISSMKLLKEITTVFILGTRACLFCLMCELSSYLLLRHVVHIITITM